MRIVQARFVGAFMDPAKCPADRPAIAFTGRSNVGKSSLVNRFCNRVIARTSKTPGRTRQLVYFDLESDRTKPFYLVDLPGYGYAAGPEAERKAFTRAARKLLADPARRAAVVQLVDVSVPWQDSDLEMIEWLLEDDVPFVLALTKCDRVNRSAPARKLAELRTLVSWREDVDVIATSAKDNEGIVPLRKWAEGVLAEAQRATRKE